MGEDLVLDTRPAGTRSVQKETLRLDGEYFYKLQGKDMGLGKPAQIRSIRNERTFGSCVQRIENPLAVVWVWSWPPGVDRIASLHTLQSSHSQVLSNNSNSPMCNSPHTLEPTPDLSNYQGM